MANRFVRRRARSISRARVIMNRIGPQIRRSLIKAEQEELEKNQPPKDVKNEGEKG